MTALQMYVVPRLQGDGMDSEALRQQELSPQTKRRLSGARRNLTASHKAATVSRSQQPQFVPKEPVKGAVKAVDHGTGPHSPKQPVSCSMSPQRGSLLPYQINSTPLQPGRAPPALSQQLSPITASTRGAHPLSRQSKNGDQCTQQGQTAHQAGIRSPVPASSHPQHQEHASQSLSRSDPSYHPPQKLSPKKSVKARQTLDNVTSTVTVTGKAGEHPVAMETIKNISVPVYAAPGHLHIKTYETIKNSRQKQEHVTKLTSPLQTDSSCSRPVSNVQDAVLSTPTSSPSKALDDRQVEGGDKMHGFTMTDSTRQLQDSLDAQLKVNAELKKLLVASMGDDLHYKVEALVRTKTQLAQDVGGYSEKLYQGYEEVDKLAIQADMWHSKYRATQLLVDDLTSQRGLLYQDREQLRYALHLLIQEQHQVKDLMVTAHKHLHQLKDALGPHHRGSKVTGQPSSVLDLAKVTSLLADGVRFSLLGTIPPQPTSLDSSMLVSPAEQIAYQVLYQPCSVEVTSPEPPGSLSQLTRPLTSPLVEQYSRFHPQIRYHNLTFNCCKRCKGDIHVV